MNRSRTIYYGLPLALCLLLYSKVWGSWFFQDDFGWLYLNQELAASNLWSMLTRPMAQGTWRPLSERAQFMILPALFGLDATPHHVLAMLTQCFNLLLLNNIVRRLSGSELAGCLSASFWAVNGALALPIGWPSAYSQIESGAFLLAALWCWIRYAESGERRYLLWQWGVFLTGFAVQELNVVYPALALGYALLFAPRLLLKTVPLFAVSLLYTLAHNRFAPKSTSGYYGLQFGAGILHTIQEYCALAVWPWSAELFTYLGPGARIPVTILLCGFVMAILVWAAISKARTVLFGAVWFFVVLSPFTLLPNHVADYYLSVPTAGLGIVLGCAMAALWVRSKRLVLGASLVVGVYFLGNAAVAYQTTKVNKIGSSRIRSLVLGVGQIAERFPGKSILISGIDNHLISSALYHHPFALVTPSSIYLTPLNASQLEPFREYKEYSSFTLPEGVVRKGISNGSIVVFEFLQDRFRNITELYQSAFNSKPTIGATAEAIPRKLLLGLGAYTYLLEGGEWHQPEQNFRWMGKTAGLRIGAPQSANGKLHITGYCAPAQIKKGPLHLTVSIDKEVKQTFELANCDQPFALNLALANQQGKASLLITFEVDRTSKTPPDIRDLGIALEEVRVE